ncbi:hypothetical protein C0Q70_08510 [Pomacea canaliculata]|uniref:Phospholipase B-like n=1 Tax=Pomacea canaliculata TaxID=400727 RepID=A0A2T7PI22_POMCA|nr:hypothetical protein C0Q70_08510 [Pomacea canaliculata]
MTFRWAYLTVETSSMFPDAQQAYAAGLVEGYLTEELMQLNWLNTLNGYCSQPYSQYCLRLHDFLGKNLDWMKVQIKSKAQEMPYWHQVELFLLQSAGLANGIKKQSTALNMDIDVFGLYMFQVGGDFEDLESVLGKPDIQRPLGSGSCSALVKVLPDNSDLYVAQDTWNNYQGMLRILKVYNFSFSLVDGTSVKYLVNIILKVSMETTIGNSNPDLWKYVTPESVLEGIRSVVANRLSTSGSQWASIFSAYNSGTYNNEWMVIDYKKFIPGAKTLMQGLLTVLDQIPGTIQVDDLTNLLSAQGYFPSYNVPYFPDIFNASGNQALVDKYGDWFTYDKTPRALIFRRDHQSVSDVISMTKLMRYNDFTKDPLSRCNCTPPYSAENAISARSDLNPANGTYPFGALSHRSHGGVDMKLTTYQLAQSLAFVAVGGPTWDQNPPFQWSKSDYGPAVPHFGQPDLWQFSPILFNGTGLFPVS